MKENESLLVFINYILHLPEKQIPITIDKQKLTNELDFNFFEDNEIFHTKILSHLLAD